MVGSEILDGRLVALEYEPRLARQAPPPRAAPHHGGRARRTTIDAPKAALRFDFSDRLAQVELPTLVLAGRKDRSVTPEQARALADGIPTASLQRFPDAGHLVVVERAEQIASAVTEFSAR